MEYLSAEQCLPCMEVYKQYCIGTANRCGQEPVPIYDMDQIIGHLMDEDKMSYEDACDYFEYNIMGAWSGPSTPYFLNPVEKEDAPPL